MTGRSREEEIPTKSGGKSRKATTLARATDKKAAPPPQTGALLTSGLANKADPMALIVVCLEQASRLHVTSASKSCL
jgi:hypothetical protein